MKTDRRTFLKQVGLAIVAPTLGSGVLTVDKVIQVRDRARARTKRNELFNGTPGKWDGVIIRDECHGFNERTYEGKRWKLRPTTINGERYFIGVCS